jgi:hypothetical protein
MNSQSIEESFSEDSKENLRIENEILKLKMQAEHGAIFGEEGTVSPKIENEFLNHVQQFEEARKNVNYVKVYDLIGRPSFKKASELFSDEVEVELRRLQNLMAEKNLFLDVLGGYDLIIIYQFITEELFEHETDNMLLPGWSRNFIYEEFHANHKMDIEKSTEDFLRHWFNKQFDEYSIELNKEMITADGKIFTEKEVKNKLNNCFQFFLSFNNAQHSITEIKFEWNAKESKGIGHAEGEVSYDAEVEKGDTLHIEGPFKFYLSNEYGYWTIFYFVFPGFGW